MQQLQFPSYDFRLKNRQNKPFIFDRVRKKFVTLSPEEWVRQHVVQYLIRERNYPLNHINVEKQLLVNGLKKRYDIVVFNADGSIHLLVECKAPKIAITQSTFDQIASYNLQLDATFLMVTNGLKHYYCQLSKNEEKYTFLTEIPDFSR